MEDEGEEKALSRREKRALEMGIRSGMIVKRKGDVLGLAGVSKHGKRQVAAEVKRGRKVEERGRKEWEWGVEKRGNMQKHYRDPLLQ
jgi:pre-60S factor REI1